MHLVAFHGYPLDHRIWSPLAARAARGTLGPITSVFAPDFRGRGISHRPAAPVHTMSLLADDMAEEISRALPAGEPFLLAGLSMGGYVAFEFLKRHGARERDRLRGLALFERRPPRTTTRAAQSARKPSRLSARTGSKPHSPRCCRSCSRGARRVGPPRKPRAR